MTPPQNRNAAIIAALALILTTLVYIGALRFQFSFDDIPGIVANPMRRAPWPAVLRAIPHAFTQHLWEYLSPGSKGNFYRPISTIWGLINLKLWNVSLAGWHASTLALHIIAVWLVYHIARRVLRNDLYGAVASLLFGLHPTHIETAAVATGHSESLVAVEMLASILCWAHFRERTDSSRWRWFASAIVLAIFALLTKETAIVLPAIIGAWELWIASSDLVLLDRVRLAFAVALPFLALDVWYLAIRKIVLSAMAFTIANISVATMLLTWPSVVAAYVRHLLWPLGMSQFYDTPYVYTPTLANFWLPLAVIVVLAAALIGWSLRSKSGVVAFCCAWMLLPLLPALNLRAFQFGENLHDRYLYIPSVGFAILVAYVLSLVKSDNREILGMARIPAVIVLVLTAFYGIATARQSVYWATPLLVYTRGVEIAPNNVHALNALSQEFLRHDRKAEAVPVMQRMTVLAPSDWNNRFLLGMTLLNLQRYQEADRAFQGAIEIDPNNAGQYYFQAVARVETHDNDGAEQSLRRAIELLPVGHGFHELMARLLYAKHDVDGARAELRTELANDPQNQTARQSLHALEGK